MPESPVEIGFVLFPDLTMLDFVGPWEILSRLERARCHVVAAERAPVVGGGLAVQPTATFADCPSLDILCVPGGPGHLRAMENDALLAFLRHQAQHCRFTTSVCTGSLVLAAAGLLEGYRATTHWLSLDRLSRFGAIPVKDRVVIDRDRITGGGVTAGIDFGLTLAALLDGETVARRIQLQVEYRPAPPFGDGHPDSAAPALVEAIRRGTSGYTARMAEVDARVLARLEQGDDPR